LVEELPALSEEAAAVAEDVASAFRWSDHGVLGHIFREVPGHVATYNDEIRNGLVNLWSRVAAAGDLRSDLLTPSKVRAGVQIFTQDLGEYQAWVELRIGVIQNAGVNQPGAWR